MRALSLLSIVLLFICSVPINAQEEKKCALTTKLPSAEFFPSIRAGAISVIKAYCENKNDAELKDEYLRFLGQIEGWFTTYGGYQDGASPIAYVRGIVEKKSAKAPEISPSGRRPPDGTIRIGETYFSPASPDKCDSKASPKTCWNVAAEFIKFYGFAAQAAKYRSTDKTLANLTELRANWEPFLQQMRGQTILETYLNHLFYSNDTDGFQSPPNSQIIVLHPTFLIENVSGAIDGEETQEALAIEILGINWWKQDKWYLPSGGSLIAVYADRDEVQDWGYGLAVHFKSVYTIGVTQHDDETGFFVSVDFLKFLQNKGRVFKQYTGESLK